ncbi:hypothetical protein K1719_045602 [Acacia pycnantha]|nr:hypothetical protein K1719_045602 [Acacia pycnantha]
MASSDAFGLLRKLITEENSESSSDPILDKFKAIVKKLEDNPESTSWLRDLIEIHNEWQVLKKNKPIKRVFSFDNAAQTNEQLAILSKLAEIENLNTTFSESPIAAKLQSQATLLSHTTTFASLVQRKAFHFLPRLPLFSPLSSELRCHSLCPPSFRSQCRRVFGKRKNRTTETFQWIPSLSVRLN